MGYGNALGMAEQVVNGLVSLENALHYHLTANHYPPFPAYMVTPAQQAIQLGNQGEWDQLVDLPEGVRHNTYGASVPAQVVIASLHLEVFLSPDVDDCVPGTDEDII